MHEVAQVLAQRRTPMPLRDDVLGPGDRQRADVLDRPPPPVRLAGVGLVELLGADLRWRRLVHPDLLLEPAGGLRCALDHQVAPQVVVLVAQALGIARGGRQQQQPRSLDGIAGHRDGPGALVVLASGAQVVDAGDGAGALVDHDPADHAVRPDLGTVRQRIRDVGDQRAGLGVDLAALQAETTVDAVRPVAEPSVRDGYRADPGVDAGRPGAAQEDLAVPAHPVGMVRVAVRIAPRPVLPGDRQLLLDRLVVRPELGIVDRPVRAHPVQAEGVEVGRVEAGCVAGEVHHRAADAAAGVVGSERHRVVTADLARLGPVQGVRAPLVGDPVGVRIPERPGVQADHPPARPGPAAGSARRRRRPAPTTTRSTSSPSAYRRMSRRSRWSVRLPSLGISQAEELRALMSR